MVYPLLVTVGVSIGVENLETGVHSRLKTPYLVLLEVCIGAYSKEKEDRDSRSEIWSEI